MSASNHPNQIYLVMDAGSPVAAFTSRPEMKTYLKRRYGTFNDPMVYTFGGEQGYAPAIMTMSAALADGESLYLDEHNELGYGREKSNARPLAPPRPRQLLRRRRGPEGAGRKTSLKE
jgi:hypothetical protein